MIPQEQIDSVIAQLNKNREATIAEFLYTLFKDKFVEVYLGDAYEDVSTEQVSTPYAAVFSGRVVAAYKECLVMEGSYIDRRTRECRIGKQIFISERSIRGLCEVDGNGILDDIFLRSREALETKNLAGSPQPQKIKK
jgi:hypothetical protein